MTRNEYELMYLIRTNDNPQQALMTAIDIICQYIKKTSDEGVPLDFIEQAS